MHVNTFKLQQYNGTGILLEMIHIWYFLDAIVVYFAITNK